MRFAHASLVALVGVIAMVVVGIIAWPHVFAFILAEAVRRNPHTTIVMLDPGESVRVGRDVVLALVTPWLVVWLALLAHRLRYGALPPTKVVVFAYALPPPVVVIAMALHTWSMLALVSSTDVAGGIAPMLSFSFLSPGAWGIGFGAGTTALFVAITGLVVGRRKGDSPKR